MPAEVSKTDQRFPKSSRIRKRSRYLEVQSGGAKVHGEGFLGIYLGREDLRDPRLGITVTKKVGTAVVRNRLKRLVKEAFRLGLMPVPRGTDVVVVAKRTAADMSTADLFADLRSMGRRAVGRMDATR